MDISLALRVTFQQVRILLQCLGQREQPALQCAAASRPNSLEGHGFRLKNNFIIRGYVHFME